MMNEAVWYLAMVVVHCLLEYSDCPFELIVVEHVFASEEASECFLNEECGVDVDIEFEHDRFGGFGAHFPAD